MVGKQWGRRGEVKLAGDKEARGVMTGVVSLGSLPFRCPCPSLGGDFDLFSQATPLYQTIDTVEHSYTLVDTPKMLSQVVEKLSAAPLLSFDWTLGIPAS